MCFLLIYISQGSWVWLCHTISLLGPLAHRLTLHQAKAAHLLCEFGRRQLSIRSPVRLSRSWAGLSAASPPPRCKCFKNRPLTGGPAPPLAARACLILGVCLKWGMASNRKPAYPQIWTIFFNINLTGNEGVIWAPVCSLFVFHLGSGLERGRE